MLKAIRTLCATVALGLSAALSVAPTQAALLEDSGDSSLALVEPIFCRNPTTPECVLEKDVIRATATTPHTMTLVLTGLPQFLSFEELAVRNFSDRPWTDYHVTFETRDLSDTIVPLNWGLRFGVGEMVLAPFIAPNVLGFDIFFTDPIAPGLEFGFFADLIIEGLGGSPGLPFVDVVQYPTFASVPEPGTLALLGLSLAGLAATRRRKQ